MSSNPADQFPEVSAQFAATSAQMRKHKVDILAEMRRILEECNGITYTPEEWAKTVLSIQIDRAQRTPEGKVADMRSLAEDFRCNGHPGVASALNELANEAERTFNT